MDYYYHGTGLLIEDGLGTMIKIIEFGGIKSKRLRNASYMPMYNGEDYISVSRWILSDNPSVEEMMRSSFFGWIFCLPCFILSGDIEATHAKMVTLNYTYDASKERVSSYFDEWHVKDEIPLDKVVGIAIPFSWGKESKKELLNMCKILVYARLYGWKVYDSNVDLIEKVRNEETCYEFEGTKQVL